MLFWKKKTPPLVQSSASAWREQWRAIVPPECRNVPVTVGDKTVTAYVQINHFVMMLRDGLLMEEHFFRRLLPLPARGLPCHLAHALHAGHRKRLFEAQKAARRQMPSWKWRKPTTNFGRWTSDNHCVTILLQYKPAPDGPLEHCTEHILQRVQWAESSDNAQMVPSRTEFATVGVPGTPRRACQLAPRRLYVGRFVKFICIFSHNLTCEISHNLSYLGLFCFVVPFRYVSFFHVYETRKHCFGSAFYFYHNGGFCIETYNQLRSSRLGKIGLHPNVRTT